MNVLKNLKEIEDRIARLEEAIEYHKTAGDKHRYEITTLQNKVARIEKNVGGIVNCGDITPSTHKYNCRARMTEANECTCKEPSKPCCCDTAYRQGIKCPIHGR